jgi:hypothetical protein
MADTNLNTEAALSNPKRPLGDEFINTLSVDTIVPSVYTIGQYSTTADQKAAQLTTLLQDLLSLGVFNSMEIAFSKGVPVGTFIVVDDPETPETEFSVQVVREVFIRDEQLPEEEAVRTN